jgi:cholesterol oxidase
MLKIMAALAPLKNILQLRARTALRQLRYGVYDGDLRHTQLLYIVSHDDASGRLRLVNDRITVEWPGYSDLPQRVRAEQKAREMIEKMGGVFGENPFAMSAFGGNRIIAHPLGGAGMANSADQGVVSPDGRVFDPSKGPQGIHEGLYVCDGAAISSAVGVSPLLTITALAERAMILAARRLGRVLDVGTSPARPARDALM